MKTVMQRLVESFDDYQHESHNDSITIEKLKEVIVDEYLKIEREQILDAFVAGDERGTKDIPFNAEQYYSQTYES